MVPVERAMLVSYRLSIATIVLSKTRHNLSPTLKLTGGESLESKISDVNQILTRSGRHGAVICKKKLCQYLLPFKQNAQT